jgi:hypothetical protein
MTCGQLLRIEPFSCAGSVLSDIAVAGDDQM